MKRSRVPLILIILGAGLLLRILALLVYPSVAPLQDLIEGGDGPVYVQLAENLYTDGSFHFDRGGPTAYRTPGYPLFLLLTYVLWGSLYVVQGVQIFIDILTILGAFLIGAQLSDSEVMPLIGATFIAFNPLLVITSLSLRPETVTICLLTVTIWLLLKEPDSIRTGILVSVLLSAGVYLKPNLIGPASAFLLAFGLRWWRTSKGGTAQLAALLPLLCLILALMPWLARNYVVFNAFVPLTTSNASNLYGGNNPLADGGYVSSEPYVLPDLGEIESDRILRERAIDWIKSNPQDFARLLPAKAARLFWPLSFGTSAPPDVSVAVSATVLVLTLAHYVLVLYGAWQLATMRRFWELLLLAITPIILLLLTLATFGAARFLLPAFPAFAVLVALALEPLSTVERASAKFAH